MCMVTADAGDTTSALAKRACALDGTTSSAPTPGHSTGPQAENVQAVDPVGVAHSTQSQP